MRFSTSVIRFQPSFAVRLSLLIIAGSWLQSCVADNPVPRPIVATTSTSFLGNDGLWSAVSIRVGSPEQWLSVLPSTLSQETWVVGPSGCDGTSTCETLRGGLFFANESSTFQEQGFFDLDVDDKLQNLGTGYYGLDNLYLDDQTMASDQIIAVVNSTTQESLWVGSLGLGVQQTRLAGTENLLPFLSSLVNNSIIPSHSYGYTAGAYYRLKQVPASLVLGGYMASRFVSNDISFTLNTDYAPVVAINSISVSASPQGEDVLPPNWNSSPAVLLGSSEAALFTIDSSTPFLWFPEAVCDNFASALNLTYDENLQLYLFPNTSSPDDLNAWNLTFTFALGDSPRSSENLVLTLPYYAFDLQLSYPFPGLEANFTSPPTNYFPLRRAANSTQYTIGRVFLQETYLTVDYERGNFSLSQAMFTQEAINSNDLWSISRPDNSTWPGPPSTQESVLSTGAKIGIGIGAAIGGILLIILAWIFCVKRRAHKTNPEMEKKKRRSLLSRLSRPPDSKTSVSELLGDKRHPTEAPGDSARFELSGGHGPVEMPAAAVPSIFLAENTNTARQANDPRRPAELEHRGSMDKNEGGPAAGGSLRSGSPVPPYSPAEITPRQSNSISPYTPRHSHGFGTIGTASSGEQGISPVGGSSSSDSRRTSDQPSATPSPISPIATTTRSQRQSGSNSSDGTPVSPSTNMLLVPPTPNRTLSRSASRSSRFREEGLSTVSEERPATAAPGAAHTRFSPPPRFSWEQ